MILLTRAFVIRIKITKALSWSVYSSAPDLKMILGSLSRLGLFSTTTHVYVLRAEELSPPEAGPPTITSICFSMGPFGWGEGVKTLVEPSPKFSGIGGSLSGGSSGLSASSLGALRIALGPARNGAVSCHPTFRP
ncbi:hypothetical protein BHM03_00040923 [Ensete ventricosum]|nr:hypothetical protein BHM03_00040923 [Ensete ventricosum]